MIDQGVARTPFMLFGERVRMQAFFEDGRAGPFGAIDQQVVALTGEEAR
jgi:fumarylacetoacetate (FAA) hydrolase